MTRLSPASPRGRRFRIRPAVLLACGLGGAGSASAQADHAPIGVSLFGVADVDLRAVRNGDSRTDRSVGRDGLSRSRLGVRGTEDLGDGLRVGFWLEASVEPDTGATSTRFFNRRSTVSLVVPRWGEVRLGRDETPLYAAYGAYDPFGTTGLGAIIDSDTNGGTSVVSALGSGARTLTRADNQIGWFLPAGLGGLYGQLAAAPPEGVVGNRYRAARLGYGHGAFDVSGGLVTTDVAEGGRYRQRHLGAALDLQVVKVSGQVLRSSWDEAPGGGRRQRVHQLGLSVPFGRQKLRVDAIRGDMRGGPAGSGYADGDAATKFAVGWQIDFSRRTAVYATVARLRNRGASRLVLADGRDDPKPGEASSGAEVGLRHSF